MGRPKKITLVFALQILESSGKGIWCKWLLQRKEACPTLTNNPRELIIIVLPMRNHYDEPPRSLLSEDFIASIGND